MTRSSAARLRLFVAFAALLGSAAFSARAELQWFNSWVGHGIGFGGDWSAYSDLAKPTGVFGIAERCVHENVYVRFRNNGPSGSVLRFRFAFGPVGGQPLGTDHALTLSAGESTQGILVPAFSCDGISTHRYEVFVGSL